MTKLEEEIFSVTDSNFEQIALEIFHFQYQHIPLYQNYCRQIKRNNPKKLNEIPFLPIQFFKKHSINCFPSSDLIFHSSGTTGNEKSSHFVHKKKIYEKSFFTHYQQRIGNPEQQVIFALLPNYIEQGNSSLVYMLDFLIKKTNHNLSGFYLYNTDQLIDKIQQVDKNKKIVIFGVSYALLDLSKKGINLSNAIIIETGGMKGRRKEMSKTELHENLKNGFHCQNIYSEYGMTELLSQSYSRENEIFTSPNWKKVFVRDNNDPFTFVENGKTGALNIIDLANLYSCSFIETQDLGKKVESGFQVLGRMELSDLRGCNLLYNV